MSFNWCFIVPRRCCYRWGRYRVNLRVESSLNVESIFYLPVRPTIDISIKDYVEIYDYEIEALTLVHYEGLTIDEAAVRMNLSKSTFWRILEQVRFKLAKALSEHKPIKIVSTKQRPQELTQ